MRKARRPGWSGTRPAATRPGAAFAAASVAIAIDHMAPDPPDRWHPVAWFGRAMAGVERCIWRDHRVAGLCYTAIGVSSAALVGSVAQAVFARPIRYRNATIEMATFAATTIALGGGGLDRAACAVQAALEVDDLDEARRLLPWLVGRDPSGLDRAEIARAVVESVAENTVDAVVAPALYGAVFGAPGVLVHRAANTMDAMVGHRSERYERFGWAPARLDDALNFVPARLAAALVAAVRPHRAAVVWRIARRDAPRHPSPNAGVIEAAFAAALALRLGGTNRYGVMTERRAALGDGPAPTTSDIARCRRLARDVDLATAGACAAIALVLAATAYRSGAYARIGG